MTGYIHSVETMGLVDGPGVRTVVFLQGCPLRCQYCHNPDTWTPQLGTVRTVDDLVKQLVRMKPYFKSSGGGVTFSGGEPLLQADFVTACMKALKTHGIHTCLDTSGSVAGDFTDLLSQTDLILYDCKHPDKEGYHNLTGGKLSVTEDFLQQAQQAGVPLWVRHVVVPDITDGEAHMARLQTYISRLSRVEQVELLPYHTLGHSKYQNLNIPEPLADTPAMDKERCSQLQTRYFR